MNLPNPNVDAKFIVEVRHVKEVTLAAAADLAFWQNRLHDEALFPFDNHGTAELVISATELHSMGRRTNELSIGLVVCEQPTADSPDALYLVRAFNSSRLFAWIERTFFVTPYYPGRIRVDDRIPAQIQLEDQAGMILSVRMNAGATPHASRDELWQGKIYLPRHKADVSRPLKYFVAKLGGRTDVYPYVPEANILQMDARERHPVFQWMLDSNLVGKEWRIRDTAVHARSRSY